jgi:hypothetical protein
MRRVRFRLVALFLVLAAYELDAQIRINVGGRRGRDSTQTARDSAAAREQAARAGAANRARQRPRTLEEIAGTLPETSLAHPEILGWRLGLSTIEEIRVALGEMTPQVVVREALPMPLVAQSAGVGSVKVPDSEHVATLRAESQVYVNQSCYQPTVERGNCERYSLRFASPPSTPVLLGVEREVMLAPHALRDVVEASLGERFGEPTHRTTGPAGMQRLIWVWGFDGELWTATALNPENIAQGRCMSMRVSLWELGEGCAVVLNVDFAATPEGFVTRMVFKAEDFHTRYFAQQRTKALEDSVVAEHVRQLREAASKVRSP